MVLRKETIGYTVNSRKILQEYTVIDPEKNSQHKTSQNFWNKEEYEGETSKRNCYTDDSQTVNDDGVIKLDI